MKKFKVLILTLVLFALPLMANNIDAQTINSIPTQGIFSSIGDFFGNLFGGEEGAIAYSGEVRNIEEDVDTANEFAKNIANGCMGSSCDTGTDVVDLSNIDGIDIDKSLEGTTSATGEVSTDPLQAGDTVLATLRITNTGNLDPKDTTSITVIDEVIEDYIEYSGPVTATALSDNKLAPASEMAHGSDSITSTGVVVGTVQDLKTTGIVIDGVDAKDQFELTFTGTVKSERPSGTSSSQTENDAKACKPYKLITDGSNMSKEYSEGVHIDENGQYDGVISNESGSYTLCDVGSDDIYVQWDKEPVVPGLPSISADKSVEEDTTVAPTDGDGIAEPGETLTYSFFFQNEGEGTGTFFIQDLLNDPSFANVTFNDDDELKSPFGDLTLNQNSADDLYGDMDPDAAPLLISDLKAGFYVTLDPKEFLEFSFTVTVNSTIDFFVLHNGSDIYNSAKICLTSDTSIDKDCTDVEEIIPADPAADLETNKKVVSIDGVDNATTIDSSKTAPHEVKYEVVFKNTGETDRDVVLSDNTSSIYLTAPASPKDVLNVTLDGTPVTTPTYTYSDLAAGIPVNMAAGSTITVKYTLITNTQFDDDLAAGKVFTSDQLANIASVCLADKPGSSTPTSDCDEDGGLIGVDVTPMEDGKLDVLKSSQLSNLDEDGKIQTGTIATYTFEINNDTNSSQIINLFDALDDQSFNLTDSDANDLYISDAPITAPVVDDTTASTTAATRGKFVDKLGADVSGYTVEDLHDSSKPVYVEVAQDAITYVSFDIKLTIDDLDDTIDDAGDVENNVEICADLDESGTIEESDCTNGGNVIDLDATGALSIEKVVEDASGNDIAEPGEILSYTVTVINKGTSTMNDIMIDDELLSGYYDSAYIANPSNVANITTGTGSIQPPYSSGTISLADLHAGNSVEVDGLAPGSSIVIEFDIKLLDVFPEELGTQQVSNTACTHYETDPATTARAVETNEVNVDACTTAEIKTDLNVTTDNDVTVAKNIIDAGGDGIADAGEKLTMEFIVSNTTSSSTVVRIEEDDKFDPNLDYASALTNPINDPDAALVEDMSGDNVPTTAKVDDLIDIGIGGKVKANGSIYVAVPAESSVNLSFDVNVLTPYVTSRPPELDYNNAIYTDDSSLTTLTSSNATPIVATIPTPGYEHLAIEKSVVKSYDSKGDELTNGTVGSYGQQSGKVDYSIVITNDGSLPINDITLIDMLNIKYFDVSTDPIVKVEFEDGSTTNTTLSSINAGEVFYPSTSSVTPKPALDKGETMTITFTAQLKSDLDEYFMSGEMIPNTAETCYLSKTVYNMDFPTEGTYCYSSGVDLPLLNIGGDITTVDPDDPNFAIEKTSDVGTDHVLSPGEVITYNILVTNNGIEKDSEGLGLPQEIILTDEMFEENIDYATSLSSSKLVISNLGDRASGTATATKAPKVQVMNGTAWEDPADINNIDTYRLLPKSDYTKWLNPDTGAKAPLDSDDWRSNTTDYPDDNRGGIKLIIPANTTYQVSFKVNAQGNFKTIDRVKNFFDFKRFF